MKQALPNILTGLRLVLSLLVFLGLIALSLPVLPGDRDPSVQRAVSQAIYFSVFFGFVIAAVTDFFDGWLARRWQVTSMAGAILDPIADKVLVCGAIVGLSVLWRWQVALPGGLILIREFSVSALRETLAPKGIKLPVTVLAKWKTTLQLVALTAVLFVGGWPFWGLGGGQTILPNLLLGTQAALWVAAAVTIWTGIEYGLAARKALLGGQ